MRVSEFRQAVLDEFGAGYGRVVTGDLVLHEFDGLTAEQAISAGEDTREVWLALCRAADVPQSRWYGVGLPQPR
ncbi:DUF3046 domain-containing protein [Subtercola boreus]|uniref:Signal transduction histidine kinase n=1 Tax=Subtercola boreus TaxID=120213 RepID=A0A3E0WBK2_9MICO|nr:DUF3046 domain-containing protein [Subtercola boreus]RFA21826.1 signal transduction histidine kinase [Subtercola boreus]RFA21937.1 signal transduction histidine kinase [Subtercola boreus]RFA27885.1 signal transduction histidine kinase [Subtercola boreus]